VTENPAGSGDRAHESRSRRPLDRLPRYGAAVETLNEAEVPADDVLRLPPVSRGWRVLLLLVVVGLFLAGTAVGQDTWWPFGPWRMFSTSTPPSSSVTSLRIEIKQGDGVDWRPAALSPSSVGLNRAEVEGRIPEMTARPAMLATLAHTHSRLRPKEPPWRAVRVVRTQVLLSDGKPTGEITETQLVEWTAS
jgi:hypothetical protein